MSNKQAPYKDVHTIGKINSWWVHSYPNNAARHPDGPMHIVELYRSYEAFTKQLSYEADYLTANQFAKCLVAAGIADIGGWWSHLPSWVPKEYEIRRAKVY